MHPDDELASLRRFLDSLENGSMKIFKQEEAMTPSSRRKLPMLWVSI